MKTQEEIVKRINELDIKCAKETNGTTKAMFGIELNALRWVLK